MNFEGLKEIFVKRYAQVIGSNIFNSVDDLRRMLIFYCYICPNYVMPNNYINYFTYYLVSKDIVLDYDLISYYYTMFSLYFSSSKNLSIKFVISDDVEKNDVYNNKQVVIYKCNIHDKVDYNVLADIFYQVKYLLLVDGISNNECYSFEQLRLVKEICLKSILGNSYFDDKYADISFSNELRRQSFKVVKDYFNYLGLSVFIDFSSDIVSASKVILDNEDKCINIDVLFDLVLKDENPNLLKELIKSYPILGCEYKSDKRKSLLNLLLDIYKNRKLLINLNKDLEWHQKKLGIGSDNIERLNRKINVCVSYIDVMCMTINDGCMTSDDLIRSISDLIIYDTIDSNVQNDICCILSKVVPRMIRLLCSDRSILYIEQLKKRVIKCYLDSMGLVRNNFDSIYFMRVYSTLELCIRAFDID